MNFDKICVKTILAFILCAPQEFSLSQVSDKVVMVICLLASNSKRKQKTLIELEKS